MTLLEKYAKLIIKKGVNLQKGQSLIINANTDAIELARQCVEEAYAAGAKQVVVFYIDEHVNRSHVLHQSEETLCNIHPWQIDSKLDYMKDNGCILHLLSEIPGIMDGVDASKLSKQRMAMAKAGKELQTYTMSNRAQWTIVAIPNKAWAKQVFPELKDEQAAVDELWKRIYQSVHIDEDNDPIEEWTKLNNNFKKREKILNDYNFKSLHFVNALGTDLVVELVAHHVWAGGCEKTQSGIEFNPNMPTEEIFSMPNKTGVNGTVIASKPLLYNGGWIEDFWFTFKDGKVVDFDARLGKDILSKLVAFDEGSSYLGEVALVPHESPISQSGILFLNTLFDENASCHLALGDAYPLNVENGIHMSEDELAKAGANHSMAHVDFMFGSADMQIDGITQDGNRVPVFRNGSFVF